MLQTELEVAVEEYLGRIASLGMTEVTTRDVFRCALNIDPNAPDYSDKAIRLGPRVAAALQHVGWSRIGAKGRAKNRRVIYRRVRSS